MNRIRLISSTGLTCCLFLVAAGWVHGQQEPRQRDRADARTQETRTTATTMVRRTSMVMGAKVRLQDNVSYGEVMDFVFNDNGCIAYVVIASEDDYVAVPWSVATFDFEQRTVSIDISREKLRQLAFTKDRWPNLSDSGYSQKLHTVFGDRAERREHRTGKDVERNSKAGDRNAREPTRDNGDKPSRSKRDDRPSGDRKPLDNKPPDQKAGKDRRDDQPSRDRDAPKKPDDQKKPDRPARTKP